MKGALKVTDCELVGMKDDNS